MQVVFSVPDQGSEASQGSGEHPCIVLHAHELSGLLLHGWLTERISPRLHLSGIIEHFFLFGCASFHAHANGAVRS